MKNKKIQPFIFLFHPSSLILHPFMITCVYLNILLCGTLYAATPEETVVKRVNSHLLIKDYDEACEEARVGVQKYPKSKELWESCIIALSKAGREKEMMQAWHHYISLFPNAHDNHTLLEEMAWGIISQGANSSSPVIRLMALLGAFYGQDAKGVNIMHRLLQDNNSLIRGATVQLAGRLHDAKLCDEILRLLHEEKSWRVRLEVIKAAGNMKLAKTKQDLLNIIANDKGHVEEKAAAIVALVNMLDSASHDEVIRLASSDRAGLRLLACQVVIYFDMKDEADSILPLLQDHSGEVRAAALQTLGVLQVKSIQSQSMASIAKSMLSDPEPLAAISAAWLLMLHDPVQGEKAFEKWIFHESQDKRIIAVAALSACGKYGEACMQKAFRTTADDYVRLNLAMGLIGQRVSTDESCRALYEGIMTNKDRWAWEEFGMFRALAPSKNSHDAETIENPEAISQSVHLEVLNVLSVMRYEKAQEAIAHFLEQKTWGVSGTAAALLLLEGDETALDLVKNLLTHPAYKVRVQAGLILALWGRDEQAISTLQQAYAKADRDLKEKILEGIGKIGAKSSVPFLVEKLEESYQTLRIISACALLQCLYH